MTPDTVVTLGDFAFQREEVPEHIPFGGEQIMDVKVMQGGARVIDVMGPSERPLEWSGLFRGGTALDRARYLDGLRRAGDQLPLNWSELSYTIVIRSFDPDYTRFYEIPYRIVCEVVENLSGTVSEAPDPAVDDAMGDDLGSAIDLGSLIGSVGLLDSLGGLKNVLGSIKDLYNAGSAAVEGVFGAIGAVQGQITNLIETAEAIAASVDTLGGVEPDNLAGANGGALAAQATNAEQLAMLYEVQSLIGRMSANLGAVGSSGAVLTVAGGTLQELAAQTYGDPSQWTAIARANDIDDPVISGVQDLRIPPRADNAGGVLRRA